jgi:hypothetical protein
MTRPLLHAARRSRFALTEDRHPTPACGTGVTSGVSCPLNSIELGRTRSKGAIRGTARGSLKTAEDVKGPRDIVHSSGSGFEPAGPPFESGRARQAGRALLDGLEISEAADCARTVPRVCPTQRGASLRVRQLGSRPEWPARPPRASEAHRRGSQIYLRDRPGSESGALRRTRTVGRRGRFPRPRLCPTKAGYGRRVDAIPAAASARPSRRPGGAARRAVEFEVLGPLSWLREHLAVRHNAKRPLPFGELLRRFTFIDNEFRLAGDR